MASSAPSLPSPNAPVVGLRRLCVVVAAWFAFSVVTEVYDKLIMMHLSIPLTLALWKFVVSVCCGIVSMAAVGDRPFGGIDARVVLIRIMPLAAMIALAKIFTYISYGHVPLSTAQLVKAATPVVTILLTRTILGERFGVQSYLSLLPISLGVGLGVGLHVEVNTLGVLAALASCIIAAAQLIYTKTLFLGMGSLRALELNLLTATCCVALLLPFWLGVQLGWLPSDIDGGTFFLLSTKRHGTPRIWMAFIICAVTQYGQSMCAYYFLEHVSPATSAVVGTARKPFIVVASMVIFHTPSSLLNICGILLAFTGVGWYNYARHVERRHAAVFKGAKRHVAAVDAELAARQLQSGLETESAASEADLEKQPLTEKRSSDETLADGGTACGGGCAVLAAWYEEQLARRPLAVKAITSGTLYGLGDLLAQVGGAMRSGHELAAAPFASGRFVRAVAYGGVFYPPLAHAHYNFLEYLVVGTWRMDETSGAHWLKMVLEQFVYWSYLSNAYYHLVLGAMVGLGPLECLARLGATFWPTMHAQWALWVPAQLINFKYVPVRHQLNFVLVLSLVWTTFLSAAFPSDGAR